MLETLMSPHERPSGEAEQIAAPSEYCRVKGRIARTMYICLAAWLARRGHQPTKMACAEGDELERSLLGALAAVSTYQVSDSTFSLMDSGAWSRASRRADSSSHRDASRAVLTA